MVVWTNLMASSSKLQTMKNKVSSSITWEIPLHIVIFQQTWMVSYLQLHYTDVLWTCMVRLYGMISVCYG